MKPQIVNKIIIPLILALLVIFFFSKIVLQPGEMIYSRHSDIINAFSSWKFLLQEGVNSTGEIPAWNNYAYSGYPTSGNPIHSQFYINNIFFFLFPSDLVFGYMIVLDFFLMGLFMFLFMKYGIKLGNAGSFISAITFMFSGTFAVRAYAGHFVHIEASVWIPLIFLFTELVVRDKKPAYGLLLGLAAGLQFLAGHTQIFFYTAVAAALYCIIRQVQIHLKEKKFEHHARKTLVKQMAVLALAALVFVLVSAVQLFPMLEISRYSARADKDFSFASSSSLPPQQLITLLIPEFFGTQLNDTNWGAGDIWEMLGYVGVMPMLLALVAVLFYFKRKDNPFVPIFLVISVFSVIVSLGKYTPLFRILFDYFPGFSSFRIPARFLHIFVFSAAALAGIGAEMLASRIMKNESVQFGKFFKILSLAAMAIFLIALFAYFNEGALMSIGKQVIALAYKQQISGGFSTMHNADYFIERFASSYKYILFSVFSFVAFLSASIAVLFLGAKRKIGEKRLVILISAVILADLFIFGMKYIDTKSPSDVFAKTDIVSFLENDTGKFRVLTGALDAQLPQHIASRYGLELVSGFDSVTLKYYDDFINETINCANGELSQECISATPLEILNVKYVITNSKLDKEFLKPVYETNASFDYFKLQQINKTAYIYENLDFLPRAYIVHDAKVMNNKKNIFNEIKGSGFNPGKYAIIEGNFSEPLSSTNAAEKAEITYFSPNKITINASLAEPGFLVLSEVWYPRWKAFVDGKEAKIYKTDYILRSVYLDKGVHNVSFVYK